MMPPVTTSWGAVLARLVALALVTATSPITVIPAVLVLHAPRPRPAGLSFLGGWLVGLSAITALSVAASGLLGGLHHSTPLWASWLRVVAGSALILAGVHRWLVRHRHTRSPGWMRAFSGITPARAGVLGAGLAVLRPEVLIMCALAGVGIGTASLGTAGSWAAGVFFVAVSASTVALPILGYAAAGDRLDDALERLKDWMERNHAGMLAVVLVLIGLMVLYNGIHAL
jgi:hypothetical protein